MEPLAIAAEARAFEFRAGQALAWVNDSAVALLDVDDGQVVLQPLFAGEAKRGGRKGSGPGELQVPVSLVSDPAGRLIVADARNLRVTRYDAGLRYVDSRPAPAVPLHLLRVNGDRVAGVWITPFGGDGPLVADLDLATGAVHGSWYPFSRSSELAAAGNPGEGPAFPAAAVLPGGDGLLMGVGMQYRLVAFDSAHAVRATFGRPELSPEMHSEAEREEIRARMEPAFRGAPNGASVIEQVLDALKHFFPANGLSVDPAGRIWVVTGRAVPDSTLVDVFSPSGALVATLPLRDRVLKIVPRGDRLAVLVERRAGPEEGRFGIDLYRVRER